ncbi:O-antigen ligase family protein [Bradyrhizobium guangxiense]
MRLWPPNMHWSRIRWSWSLPAVFILFSVVAGAPFPFGSTNDLSIAFWCLCLGIAVIFAPTNDLRRPHLWLLAGVGVIVAAYAFVLHEQLSDHPWVAPFQPIWKQASDLLGVPIAPSASIVKNEAFFALGAPLANILAIVLGITVGANRELARRMLWVIAISGAGYALYGVLSFLIEPTMILWRDKTAYLGSVTGTFINRNTAAAYFGSCAVIWMLLILEDVRRRLPERHVEWRRLSLDLRTIPPREILPQLTCLLICLMAMFMTTSRAGVGLSLLAMIVSFTLFLRKDLPPRTGIWISLGSGIAVALGLLQLLGGRVSSRFDSNGLVDEGRVEAWKSTLRIIGDNPWFGTGMGTFQWAFPPYRSPNISILRHLGRRAFDAAGACLRGGHSDGAAGGAGLGRHAAGAGAGRVRTPPRCHHPAGRRGDRDAVAFAFVPRLHPAGARLQHSVLCAFRRGPFAVLPHQGGPPGGGG